MPVSSSMDVRDALSPALRRAAAAVRDWRGFWPTAQSSIFEGIVHIFNEKGPGWKPLAKSTPPRRKAGAKDWESALPLQASGRLRASITHSNAPNSTTSEGRLELRFGSSLAYAAAMHFGLPARMGRVKAHQVKAHKRKGRPVREHTVREHMTHLPAVPGRAIVKFTPAMVTDIQKGAGRYIERHFEGAI